MYNIDPFELPKWVNSNADGASLVLAGSGPPALSIRDLIQLSSDKQTTSQNLHVESVKLGLGPANGTENLRKQIASLYSTKITADNILATNGTTGANALLFQSLIRPGDHVIAMYPLYTPLSSMPKAISGEDISYWKLDLEDQAQPSLQSLKDMIRPTTRMIILNTPNNPLGTIFDVELQLKIVALAQSQGIILVVDEIFRPLFHGTIIPPSFVEMTHDYDKIVVTSSLSKAWGLPGTRVGWMVTKNAEILSGCFDLGLYTIMALGTLDEIIAAEALSDRCRPQILAKHLNFAQSNIELLDGFISKHPGVCSWIKPSAGATAFVQFSSNGVPVDDVDFCYKLKKKKGVLLAPGSLCFGVSAARDFRGYTRIHLTTSPETMRLALLAIDEFLNNNETR